MPIRLNLLAEEQALELQHRRDPVRRAILIAVLVVIAALGVSAILWSKEVIRKVELKNLESSLDAHTNEFARVESAQKQLLTDRAHLAALVQLATNRFLCGNLLNALQQASEPNVEVTRLATAHSYTVNAGPPAAPGKIARPPTITEKIVLTLDARDFSNPPGESVLSFKDVLSRMPYFQAVLGKTNEIHLKDRSAPQLTAGGKPFVDFSLECDYPLKTR